MGSTGEAGPIPCDCDEKYGEGEVAGPRPPTTCNFLNFNRVAFAFDCLIYKQESARGARAHAARCVVRFYGALFAVSSPSLSLAVRSSAPDVHGTQRSLSLDRILDLRATSRWYLTFCNGRHCCHYEKPAFHCQASSLLPFRLHLLLSFSALYESFDRSTFASRTVAGFSSVLKTVQMLLTQWRSLVSVWRSPKNT